MQNLTIYLLTEKFQRAADAIVDGAKHFPVGDKGRHIGDLYVKRGRRTPPKWSKFFTGFVNVADLGFVQSTGGVLVVAAQGRFFALSFGQGRFLLKPESIEERFGLLVTLNSVSAGALRSIDKHTFDAVEQNSRVQVNKLSTAVEFGIDVQRDLVRGITGNPHMSVGLGGRLVGSDSLTIATDVLLPDIGLLLDKIYDKFESKSYKDQFGWIDHIHRLRAKGSKASELDRELIRKLEASRSTSGLMDGCWISIPEVIEWNRVSGFKFTRKPNDGIEMDLHLPGFIRTLDKRDVISVEYLKTHSAYAVDDDEQPVYKWPIYKCLQCEINDADGAYVLSGGSWFAVDKTFVGDMQTFFDHFPRYQTVLPVYDHASEDKYNKAVVDASGGKLVLMDAKPIKVGGIYDKVEFCDVYSDLAELLHVKRYGNSSVLGHLFNQGLISGELLKQHEDYPNLVNEKLPASHHLNCGNVPRDVSKYAIIFAIISQSTKPLHLPFFAIVALRNVWDRLQSIGFSHIYLAKVSCSPNTKIIKVPPKKVRKRRRAVRASGKR